jgi:hypothetical protein
MLHASLGSSLQIEALCAILSIDRLRSQVASLTRLDTQPRLRERLDVLRILSQ